MRFVRLLNKRILMLFMRLLDELPRIGLVVYADDCSFFILLLVVLDYRSVAHFTYSSQKI